MSEETEPVESTGKQPPELAIEERKGLLHIKIRGREFVATEQMLAQGQFAPIENIEGLRRYFDGRLNCWPDGHWTWLDGEKEERVKLVTIGDRYRFRGRDNLAQIPEPLARGYDELKWVLEGGYELVDSEPVSAQYWPEEERASLYWTATTQFHRTFFLGELLPKVYLVPVEEWQKHAEEVVGITWAATDEAAILSRPAGWVGKSRNAGLNQLVQKAKLVPPPRLVIWTSTHT